MSNWQIQTSSFLLPKSGHEPSECEDAIGINEAALRFAVADGATEAFDSRGWARLLADDWVQLAPVPQTPDDFCDFVAGQALRLHESWRSLPLSWYAEEKARTGSFAAFVGVQLELEESLPSWKAIALGDSCLIHCRNGEIVTSLPIKRPEDFNATPMLVPSHASMQRMVRDKVVMGAGAVEDGDVLLLLSDATAYWYLKKESAASEAHSLFDGLIKTAPEQELCELFSQERISGSIPDDDIAVIRIAVAGP